MRANNTIQQHEPLRVPEGWTQSEKRLIAQLTETFDDLYSRFNRIRLQDLKLNGDNGETKLDSTGSVMQALTVTDSFSAPNIAERYTGKYGAVTIGAGRDFSTFAEFAAAVSDKLLIGDIVATVYDDAWGDAYLHGIYGSGNITLNMQGHAYNSPIGLRNNNVVVAFNDGCFKAEVSVEGQTTVKFTGCEFSTGANACLSLLDGATAWVDNCRLDGTGNLIEAQRGAHLCCQDLTGQTTGNFIYARFAVVCWHGTRPDGYNNTSLSLTTPADLSTLTVDTGSGTTVTPTDPTTVTLTAELTDAYWWTSDDRESRWYPAGMLIQGLQTYRHAAVMWFDVSGLAGHTIQNATLTIKRIPNYGRTTYVGLPLYTTPLGSNDGNPRTGSVSYGDVGRIANGETKTVTLPVAAVQALADGDAAGLMLWPDDTELLSGCKYSANYARFEGTTGAAPKLTVTYT